MNALVVGGTGFIGASVARELEAQGHAVHTVAGRQHQPSGERVHAFRPGLYRDLTPLLDRTELVVYAAGSVLPRKEPALPAALQADVEPLAELLAVLTAKSTPTRFLLLSSGGAVYGPSDEVLTEASPTAPASVYGLTRTFMEDAVLFASRLSQIRGLVFRLSNIYGPGQRLGGGSTFILKALHCALNQEPLPLIGAGDQTKDFLYLDDLLRAVSCAVASSRAWEAGHIVNVCAGESHTLRAVIDAVEKTTGRALLVRAVAGGAGDVPHVQLSAAKASHLLGWRSQVPLWQGIQEFWGRMAVGVAA